MHLVNEAVPEQAVYARHCPGHGEYSRNKTHFFLGGTWVLTVAENTDWPRTVQSSCKCPGRAPERKAFGGVGVTGPCRRHVTGVGWQGVGQRGTRVVGLAGYVWTGG